MDEGTQEANEERIEEGRRTTHEQSLQLVVRYEVERLRTASTH